MKTKHGSIKRKGKRLEKILAKFQRPGFIDELERPAQEHLVVVAREHAEILRRSRELAPTRVFRAA